MTATQTAAGAAGAVTAQYDFCNATFEGGKLFSVRAGVPLSEAFEQLGMLIASAQSAIEGAVENSVQSDAPTGERCAVTVLEFAYALTQAMHQGLNRGKA